MAILYRTTGAWGAGTGADLSAVQIDNNFWELYSAIQDLIANPVEPDQIASFTVSGTSFTIMMVSGASFGPYPLPVLSFTWIEDGWENDTIYNALDTFTVDGQGLFLVLRGHTTPVAPAVFDAEALNDDDEPLYQKLIAAVDQVTYDMPLSYPEAIPGGRIPLMDFVANRVLLLPAALAESKAMLMVAASDDEIIFEIEITGEVVGSVSFVPGELLSLNGVSQGGTFNFAADTVMGIGDTLTIYSPAAADSSAARLAISLALSRNG